MKLVLRAGRLVLGAAVLAGAAGACYTGGGGTAPPTNEFYYPVGLAVSSGGTVLYAVNADFDLQWNGGTLQSYDLFWIRHDAAELTKAALLGESFPSDLIESVVEPSILQWPAEDGGVSACFTTPALPPNNGTSIGLLLGTNCAPHIQSQPYQTASVVIGAFATDLQLSFDGSRLFAPVDGSGTVTWANVGPGLTTTTPAPDDPTLPPPPRPPPGTTSPATTDPRFAIECGQSGPGGTCSSFYQTGDDPTSVGNSRQVTLPASPFGLAQSQDDTVMVVTSQTTTESSLLTTGILLPANTPTPFGPSTGATTPVPLQPSTPPNPPTMQFVASGVDNGGNGIAAIPHDPDVVVDPAVAPCPPNPGSGKVCVQPAFLQTSRDVASLDLLRYYTDDGSTLHRPYIQVESKIPITSVSGGGSDSRGIAIDATPRIACKHAGGDPLTCGELPARLFFANRSANVLATGTVGGPSPLVDDGSYNPDLITFTGNIPIGNSCGPSRVYIAPIVDALGNYEVRVFVVCFNSNQLIVYDPNANVFENAIDVGAGPFALAFDPFDINDVAENNPVPADPRYTDVSVRTYQYAYVASFTQSYVQVIDLVNVPQQNSGLAGSPTFEHVVFTLGNPTPPKGQ